MNFELILMNWVGWGVDGSGHTYLIAVQMYAKAQIDEFQFRAFAQNTGKEAILGISDSNGVSGNWIHNSRVAFFCGYSHDTKQIQLLQIRT